MRIVSSVVLMLCGWFVVSASGVAPLGQQQQQQQKQPSFRVSTDVVSVDVSAVDGQGVPVKDLKMEDFTVLVDGQPRHVLSAQFVDQAPKALPAGAATSRVLFSSNQAGETGRLILLVVDQDSLHQGGLRAASESIDHLLAGFGATDKLGLALLPGPRMPVKFGGTKQQIKEALKRVPVSPMQPRVGAIDLTVTVNEAFRIDRGNQDTLDQVVNREAFKYGGDQTMSAEMDKVGGGRAAEEAWKGGTKDIRALVQSESLRIVSEARRQSRSFSTALRNLLKAIAPIDAPKIMVIFSQGLLSPEAPTDMLPLATESAAARTAIYAVRLDRAMFDVENLRSDAYLFEDRDSARAGIEAVAGRARGRVIEITANAAGAFDRLASEMSGYYLLGIEPTDTDRDGKKHQINVKTARSGVTLRARPEFTFTPPPPARASAGDETKQLMDTMGSLLPVNFLPVRVTTFTMADEDSAHVRLLVSAEIDREQERGGPASVGFLIYDDTGKVLVNYSKHLDLERLPSGTLRFVVVPSIPSGSYTLKFAAVHNGRAGSVEHRFTATLASAPPLKFGDLVLTDGREVGTQLKPPVDNQLATDTILGFTQMAAGAGAPKDASFTLELAKTDKAPALLTAPLSLFPAKNGVQSAAGRVDVHLLPPGDYTARLVVSIGGQPLKTLTSPFWLVPVPRRAATLAEAPAFRLDDVLAPAFLGPVLDDVAAHVPDASKPTIETARAGRFDEALKQAKSGASDPSAPFVRGLSLMAKGDLQAASDAFRASVRATPDLFVGAFYIGACYAAGGKDAQAVSAWQTSLVSLDRYPAVYGLLADALLRAGEPKRAVDLLDEATGKWPDDESLKLRAAKSQLAAGMHELALTRVDQMLETQPKDASLAFLALQTVFEMALGAPDIRLPTLISRMERYRDLYAAANGPNQALVAEWLAYFGRRKTQ